MEPDSGNDPHRPRNWLNPTVLALLGGLVVLLLIIAYFATDRSANPDRLKDSHQDQAQTADRGKLCASQDAYDAIKAELFRRAAQLRGNNQDAYQKLADIAVARMENPVMESEAAGGVLNCSGSLSLDLPPGVATSDGRRTLMADVDYRVQANAAAEGAAVQVGNADAIVRPLSTLVRTAPVEPAPETNEIAPEDQEANEAAPEMTSPPVPRAMATRPSFDCSTAETRGEVAVCSNAGLAALDRSLAAQYARALAAASPEEEALLRGTDRRFRAYRDRCPTDACIGDAYTGRMSEIRDIMEDRWQGR